jgi:hypothetical protein
MAKVRFSKLSDDERTPFDGSGVSSPSGYNRFTTPSPAISESKQATVEPSIEPEDSTKAPDASRRDETDLPLVPPPRACGPGSA